MAQNTPFIPKRRVLTGLTFIKGCYLGRTSMAQGHRLVPIIPARLLLAFEFAWNAVICWVKGHDRTMEPITEVHEDGKFPCCMCGRWVAIRQAASSTVKFCKDCKWMRQNWLGGLRRCLHPLNPPTRTEDYLVTGEEPARSCGSSRLYPRQPCGPEGKLWEAKR